MSLRIHAVTAEGSVVIRVVEPPSCNAVATVYRVDRTEPRGQIRACANTK